MMNWLMNERKKAKVALCEGVLEGTSVRDQACAFLHVSHPQGDLSRVVIFLESDCSAESEVDNSRVACGDKGQRSLL